MQCKFHRQFLKDLEKIEKGDRVRLFDFLEGLEGALWEDLCPVKIKGYRATYRFRVGNYRLGFTHEEGTLVFRRCLHRKNIYKKFP